MLTSSVDLAAAERHTQPYTMITNNAAVSKLVLVKAADVIDLLVQAYALERAGAKGLDEFWAVAHDPDFQLPAVAHEVVSEVLQSLLDARNEL